MPRRLWTCGPLVGALDGSPAVMCHILSLRRVAVGFLATVLLLQCVILYRLIPETEVVLITHAGSHSRAVCRAIEEVMRQGCRWRVKCPTAHCQMQRGMAIRERRAVAVDPRLFVLILRDPRDVVTPRVTSQGGQGDCPSKYQCAVQDIQAVVNWTEARHREHSEQPGSFVLLYEAVALQPRETLQALAGFLQMDPSVTDQQVSAWQSVTEHGAICQTTSYPSWIASYVNSVMQKGLSPDLWNHWASCSSKISWAPEPCPRKTQLEVHNESQHGDVCRFSASLGFTCPTLCGRRAEAPYCAAAGSDPCRAAALDVDWRKRLVPNTQTPGIISTFYEPSAKDDREPARKQTLAAWAHHWQQAGWRTRVLGLADAKKSPFYKQLLLRFRRIPLGENAEYEKMCYFRYLAMAEAGGGWMSDYEPRREELVQPQNCKPAKP